MNAPSARRGEVWFAAVPGDKQRPVLVLTRDPLGRVLRSVISAPTTSILHGLSTEELLGTEAGLLQDSAANLDSTLLLDRTCLVRRLGRASPAAMEAACRALAIATGCVP